MRDGADAARRKPIEALPAGIHRLRSFGAGLVDDGVPRVVIQANARQRETTIPLFTEAQMRTGNDTRFSACSEVLAGVDTSAYEVVGRQAGRADARSRRRRPLPDAVPIA